MIKRDASCLRPLLPGPVPWQLNETGACEVPADAPASFVPARYAECLERLRKGGEETVFRHYWEQCLVLALRDGLRPGDVFVPGWRRYAARRPDMRTCWTRRPRSPTRAHACVGASPCRY